MSSAVACDCTEKLTCVSCCECHQEALTVGAFSLTAAAKTKILQPENLLWYFCLEVEDSQNEMHTLTESNPLLGSAGTKFPTWTGPSVTGRPHAAVKSNSREHRHLHSFQQLWIIKSSSITQRGPLQNQRRRLMLLNVPAWVRAGKPRAMMKPCLVLYLCKAVEVIILLKIN